jgi:hypothetical protein
VAPMVTKGAEQCRTVQLTWHVFDT